VRRHGRIALRRIKQLTDAVRGRRLHKLLGQLNRDPRPQRFGRGGQRQRPIQQVAGGRDIAAVTRAAASPVQMRGGAERASSPATARPSSAA
jgi:hypothetical protein